MATPPLSCWVLHDGAAGHRRQALALAQALADKGGADAVGLYLAAAGLISFAGLWAQRGRAAG